MGEVIVGIDIGTSKVATVIGILNENDEIEVMGKGIEACVGVKKGAILDVEEVYASIRSSISQAENMSNITVKSAFVNIPLSQTEIICNRAIIEIADKMGGVSYRDISKVLENSKNVNVPFDRHIVDIIPKNYFIDSYEGIKDPLGMKGTVLGVNVEIVLGRTTTVDNLVRTVEMCDIKIDGMIVDAFASAEIVLTPEEKEFGIMYIDVGGSSTDVSIFKEKEIIFNNVFHLGGDNITRDISIGLKVPIYEAEKLKREYEFCLQSLFDNDQKVFVYDVSGEKKSVNVSDIAEIIDARAKEIVKFSFEAFRNSGIKKNQITGVVLSGAGISYVDGCLEFAKNVFQLPLRISSYKGMEGVKPEFITALGILRYAANHARFAPSSEVKISDERITTKKMGIFDKLKGFFS